MSPEIASKPTKLCPTCGTRLSEDATRCLVCGTDLTSTTKASTPAKVVQASRMPQFTLGLPAIIGLLALFLTIGAGLVYVALQRTGQIAGSEQALQAAETSTPTETLTPTITVTPTPETPTQTNTPEPSPTPLAYVVKEGDVCSSIAAAFKVSVNSIVLANNTISATCDNIYPGQTLYIPQPTPTPTEMPTATLSAGEATKQACGEIEYLVQENDTLGKIAGNYGISITALMDYNGRVNDTVRTGETIKIPLCSRATPGPTPTPTPPPPYPAPNLLLPADGEDFTLADDAVTLQWAAVGTLRENEAYAITIKDVTAGQEPLVDYATDTKYLIPSGYRPQENRVHTYRWWVLTVRQIDTDSEGKPVWEPAGATSEQRVFTWTGAGSAATPTP
jgi:LysM repeat protein